MCAPPWAHPGASFDPSSASDATPTPKHVCKPQTLPERRPPSLSEARAWAGPAPSWEERDSLCSQIPGGPSFCGEPWGSSSGFTFCLFCVLFVKLPSDQCVLCHVARDGGGVWGGDRDSWVISFVN